LPKMATRSASGAPPSTIVINTQGAPPETDTKEPEPKPDRPPRWFFDEIHELPTTDWGRVWSMELHRMEPKIPGVPGSKGYLCMFLEPITLAAIQNRYGGGKFRLNLCKNGKWTKSHDFDIEGQPIYDMSRERPNGNGAGAPAAGNADFQKEFISVLREELSRSREATQGQPTGTEQVVQMLTNASDKAMEIVTKQTPQATSGLTQVREMLGALKEMGVIGGAAAAPASNPLMDKLLGAALEKLLAPVDPLAQLTQLGTLIELVEKIRGGGGAEGTPKDWKAMLVQHLPEVLNTAKEVLSTNTDAAKARAEEANARARAAESLRNVQQPGRPGQQQPPVAANPRRDAEAPGATAPPAPSIHVNGGLRTVPRGSSPLAEPAAEVAAPIHAVDPRSTTREQYDEAFKIQVVNLVRIGASAETIADFVRDVKPEVYEDLKKYTPEVITAFFAKDAILVLATQDPRWAEVIADACVYALEPEEDEEPVKVM
jgi:hypothetical protein